ncbi:hypothetical protein WJX73_009468 [Symbiochloris irregularis]|uniref:GH16 domain-containing protein n=1 Tax=Symbiochloris irregularis TaxID=706552 RepID=A0AAW1PVP5_9CHLO
MALCYAAAVVALLFSAATPVCLGQTTVINPASLNTSSLNTTTLASQNTSAIDSTAAVPAPTKAAYIPVNYLITKVPAGQQLVVQTSDILSGGGGAIESFDYDATPNADPTPVIGPTGSVAANTTAAAFANLTLTTLQQALTNCDTTAFPWAQCGGYSNCPAYLGGDCGDSAWNATCCPPANGYQQVCTRLNPYYWHLWHPADMHKKQPMVLAVHAGVTFTSKERQGDSVPPTTPPSEITAAEDEFNTPNPKTVSGTNPANWAFQNGNGAEWNIPGWGNNELETYQEQSASVANGMLTITANRAGSGYTSARLRSWGLQSFMPNASYPNGISIVARMLMPQGGQGIWPAFWMMAEESPQYCSGCGVYGSWPASGEIDIMEAVNDPYTIYSTIHYGGPAGTMSSAWYNSYNKPLTQGWHEIGVVWTQTSISFVVDGTTFVTNKCACAGKPNGNCGNTTGYYSRDPTNFSPWGSCAPFDRPFHIIFNMAVGGGWPGNPTPSTPFPQQFSVDWVRVTAL